MAHSSAPTFASAGPESDTAYKPLAYLAPMDGLRALAVLLVLWSHIPFVPEIPFTKLSWEITQKLSIGYFGVDIFFILSGFLITRILLNTLENEGKISLRTFYIKRAIRIFPVYYLCVLFYVAFFAFDGRSLVSLLTYSFNYYHALHPTPHPLEHTWSLAVEEQFYLVWPFLVAMIPAARGKLITGLFIPSLAAALALAFATLMEGTLAGDMIYMSSLTRMMSLSLGASLAYRENTTSNLSPQQACGIIGLGVSLLLLDFVLRSFRIIPAAGYFQAFALVGFALLSFGAVALLLSPDSRLMQKAQSFLTLSPLRYIGRISYGLYLYHYLLLYVLGIQLAETEAKGASGSTVLAFIVLTFGLAALSFRFFEEPLLRLKSRFARS
ncbi:MAG: acyltransferase [Rhizobiales bacterium PAR1]|nr:MAG: acyltransferase [Rhizobiales bacterium PAR1]